MTKKLPKPYENRKQNRPLVTTAAQKDVKPLIFLSYFHDSCVVVNFEHLGSGTNKRAHSCFCDMQKSDLRKFSHFLQRLHHCKKENFREQKIKNSNMKFSADENIQIKHLYVGGAFRLHGFYESDSGTFYAIALDPTHEDSKN
jgi:hypothetical protein